MMTLKHAIKPAYDSPVKGPHERLEIPGFRWRAEPMLVFAGRRRHALRSGLRPT